MSPYSFCDGQGGCSSYIEGVLSDSKCLYDIIRALVSQSYWKCICGWHSDIAPFLVKQVASYNVIMVYVDLSYLRGNHSCVECCG
jgi:hypothetical protein